MAGPEALDSRQSLASELGRAIEQKGQEGGVLRFGLEKLLGSFGPQPSTQPKPLKK